MQSVKFLQISSECSQRVQLLTVLQQFAAIEFKGFKSAFYYQKITKNDITDDEICHFFKRFSLFFVENTFFTLLGTHFVDINVKNHKKERFRQKSAYIIGSFIEKGGFWLTADMYQSYIFRSLVNLTN